MNLLRTRVHSLKKRTDGLSKEMNQWLERAEDEEHFAKNSSQLELFGSKNYYLR